MIWAWNEEPGWCPVLVGGAGLHRLPRTTFTPNPLPGQVVTRALTKLIYLPEAVPGSALDSQEFLVTELCVTPLLVSSGFTQSHF